MESNQFLLVLCAAVGIGFGLPFLIFLAFRRGGALGDLTAMGKMAKTMANPYKAQDDQMAELRQRVAALEPARDEDDSNEDDQA